MGADCNHIISGHESSVEQRRGGLVEQAFSDAWYRGREGLHAVRERRSSFGPCKGSAVLIADRALDEVSTGGRATSADVDALKGLSRQERCRLAGFEVERACPTCT